MKYEGLLLDIDNTLYNYDTAHKKALEKLVLMTHDDTSKDVTVIKMAYLNARAQIHAELSETASSHNRLLYIQRMLELLNINSMNLSLKLYNMYWDTFLDSIELYEDVIQFLEEHKHEKICLLTDLTAHIQHRKIEQLGLYHYADYVVTSEEAGKEKPHPYMFMLALQKMNMKAEEVCMIGDSYKKDILGASQLGIQSFWLNKENKIEKYTNKLIIECKDFKELQGYISE